MAVLMEGCVGTVALPIHRIESPEASIGTKADFDDASTVDQ